jgi:hypothetical protein
MALKDIPKLTKHNLRTLRHAPLSEISGALGDLGTLLPLMIALALQGSISLPTTLVFSGVFNIATGAVFGLPLPVQPSKQLSDTMPKHLREGAPAICALNGSSQS